MTWILAGIGIYIGFLIAPNVLILAGWAFMIALAVAAVAGAGALLYFYWQQAIAAVIVAGIVWLVVKGLKMLNKKIPEKMTTEN